jgi:hypothetical protein
LPHNTKSRSANIAATLVRALLGHLPKETRAKSTWQHVETELGKAAACCDTT